MLFKDFLPFLLFLVLGAAASTLAAAAPSLQISDGRVTVSMNPSGSYQVSSNITGWTFGGALPNAPTRLSSATGTDSVGAYNQISFAWLDASSRQMTGTINLYTAQDTVIFSDTLVAASAAAPSPFPNFTTIPQNLSHFSYDDTTYFAPPSFSVGSGSMPWVLFDSHANTVIFSPASHFVPAQLIGDGQTQMASGFRSTVANPPAGFTQQTIMSMSAGINHTFNIWGLALTNIYSKVRPAYDADVVLRYFGYWTVNPSGAYYYNYNTNATAPGESSAYEATLQNVIVDFTQKGIPIHYLEMDSWWYDKSNVYYDGSNAGGYSSGDPLDQPWGLFGGELNWAGDPNLFPNGVEAFSQALGNAVSGPPIPFACHSRWVDTTAGSSSMSTFYSEFGNTYSNDFSGIAGISSRFWNTLATYAKANNIQHYKQDWQIEIISESPAFTSTVNVADEFYGNMANAFAAQGVDIDYCLPPACAYLQGGEYSNVTYARVTGDGFNSGYYHDFLYTSRFTSSLGIWPYTDIYTSTQLQNLLLGDLSAGPVGTGDAIGTESASTLLLALRADGVIIKPDFPIVPTDGAFMAESAGTGVPLIASTTSNNGVTTTYATAIPGTPNTTSTFSLSMSDLGITAPAYFYNYFSQTASEVQPGGILSGQQIPSGGVAYYIIAPVGPSGIAFMGDLNKFVSNGRKRIASVTDQSGQLKATVLFAPTESQITLHGYSGTQPSVTVQSGTASAVSYSSTTGHFTVVITVTPGTPLNNDIDPARNVIVTFNTSATAPAFTGGSPTTTGNAGTAYSFSYQVDGYPSPTFSLTSGTLPPGLTLSSTGLLSGTPTQTGTFSGTVTASNGVGTAATQSFTITIGSPVGSNTYALIVSSTGMALTPTGGSLANQTLLVQEPYTGATYQLWNVNSEGSGEYEASNVPTGFVANVKGDVNTAGQPIQTYDISGQTNSLFTMTSEGGGNYNLQFVSSGKSMTVSGTTAGAGIVQETYTGATDQLWSLQPVVSQGTPAAPSITNGPPTATATTGYAYDFAYTTSGYPAPTFSVTSGSLPPGLSLSSTTGVISGAPTASGTYTGTVDAGNGVSPDATQNFTITVQQASAPSITNGPPPAAPLNASYSFTYTNSGYPAPTFSVTSGTLPTGLTLSSAGVISGTPTASGTYTGTVTASNGVGASAMQNFSIAVGVPAAPAFTNGPPSTTALLNAAYSFTYTTSGFPPPTFSVTSGTLPTGLNLSSAGVISGTPTVTGAYTGTITASNGVGTAATQNFSITIISAYTQWANGYFGSGSPSGAPTATPQNDGVPNVLKYLFGINPTTSMSATDRAALPVVGLDTTTTPGTEYLTLTYRQSPLATGLTINVQTSSALQSWTTVNPPNLSRQVGTDSATGDPIMEVGVIVNSPTEQFIRLNVTTP
jgi:hypothetical protein